jgi:hypothetical protein
MNDYDAYSWPEIMDVLMRNSKINIKPKPATKPKPAAKKADNIHVYQDQDYIDTLSGVTKIAVITISELVNQGKADFLFLRDEEVKNFWDKHLVKIVAIREEKERVEREKAMRANALAKLTPEEKKLLGIK